MSNPLKFPPRGQISREKRPIVELPTIVWVVLGVLFAVQLILFFGGPGWVMWTNYLFAFIPARFGPAPFPQAPGSAWWSMLTYGLLHADWGHLLTNSLWLAIFSKPVAMRLGALRYLALLVACVVAGALASLALHWGENLIMVGASAGVSGVLAAAIPLMHGRVDFTGGSAAAHLRPLKPIEIFTDRRALVFTIMWLGLTLLTASSQYVNGQAFLEQRVIAWDAHLGGFLMGFIAFYLLDATHPRKAVHTVH
jgi:membrane associated rhomboid family serine protease